MKRRGKRSAQVREITELSATGVHRHAMTQSVRAQLGS